MNKHHYSFQHYRLSLPNRPLARTCFPRNTESRPNEAEARLLKTVPSYASFLYILARFFDDERHDSFGHSECHNFGDGEHCGPHVCCAKGEAHQPYSDR